MPKDNIDRAIKRGAGMGEDGASWKRSPTRATGRTAWRS